MNERSLAARFVRAVTPQLVHNSMFRLSAERVCHELKHRYASGASTQWSIENLRRCGFRPGTVIDCGAFVGDWTRMARGIFPEAKFIMVEPQPNRQQQLRSLCCDSVVLEQSLLGAEDRSSVLFHMDDLGGSSVLEQFQNKCPESTSLPMQTLDSIASRYKAASPLFLKLDVQGYELEVLRGGQTTLELTECILMEVSLLPYNVGGPLFAEIVRFMDERGFCVYDVCHFHRRQSDEAAFQLDVIFV